MEKNRFAKLNFNKGFIKKGTKISEGAEPVIRITSTYNNFALNEKAMRLLDVKPGETVAMYDLSGEGATSNTEDRFFISKSFVNENGIDPGAKIGKGNGFSYSKIYGAILATAALLDNELDITEITPAQLMEKELMVESETLVNGKPTASYIATKKGIGKVIEVGDGEEYEVEGVMRKMFVIQNINWSDHDPKIAEDAPEVPEVTDANADDN